MADTNIYYLAAPYSHPDITVRDKRWEDVTCAAAELVQDGKTVVSPITMSHIIAGVCAEDAPPYDYAHNCRQPFASFGPGNRLCSPCRCSNLHEGEYGGIF